MRNKVNIDQLAIKAVEDKLEIEFPPTICITNEQIKAFGIELFKQGYRKSDEELTTLRRELEWIKSQKGKHTNELNSIVSMLQKWEAVAFGPNPQMHGTTEALIQALRKHYTSGSSSSMSTLSDLLDDWCKSVYGQNYKMLRTPEEQINALRRRFERPLNNSDSQIEIAQKDRVIDDKDKTIVAHQKESIRLNKRIDELKRALHEIVSLHKRSAGDSFVVNDHNKKIRDIVDTAQMSVECDEVDLRQLRLNNIKYTPETIEQIMGWPLGYLEKIEKGLYRIDDNKVSQLAALYRVSKNEVIKAWDCIWKPSKYNPENKENKKVANTVKGSEDAKSSISMMEAKREVLYQVVSDPDKVLNTIVYGNQCVFLKLHCENHAPPHTKLMLFGSRGCGRMVGPVTMPSSWFEKVLVKELQPGEDITFIVPE